MLRILVRDYDYRGTLLERECLINPAMISVIKFIEPSEISEGNYTARRSLVYVVGAYSIEVYDPPSIARLMALAE